jgi:hypothetical protein
VRTIDRYAKFKLDIGNKECTYKKGEKYLLIESSEIPNDYLIRQPNSPKYKGYWSRCEKVLADQYFDIVEG